MRDRIHLWAVIGFHPSSKMEWDWRSLPRQNYYGISREDKVISQDCLGRGCGGGGPPYHKPLSLSHEFIATGSGWGRGTELFMLLPKKRL